VGLTVQTFGPELGQFGAQITHVVGHPRHISAKLLHLPDQEMFGPLVHDPLSASRPHGVPWWKLICHPAGPFFQMELRKVAKAGLLDSEWYVSDAT
jgi:hypothetical protein